MHTMCNCSLQLKAISTWNVLFAIMCGIADFLIKFNIIININNIANSLYHKDNLKILYDSDFHTILCIECIYNRSLIMFILIGRSWTLKLRKPPSWFKIRRNLYLNAQMLKFCIFSTSSGVHGAIIFLLGS